jgi:hypothetical protein
MDSTALGVIIGSAVTFLSTFVSHWFTQRREERLWLRQQEAVEKERIRDEKQKEKEQLQEIYQKCLRSLSTIVAAHQANLTLSDEKRLQRLEETYNWLNLLSLTHQNKDKKEVLEFDTCLNNFTQDSNKYVAESLLESIAILARKDEVLYPEVSTSVSESTANSGDKAVIIDINSEFRRQQLIEGIELPLAYRFYFTLLNLSKTQREKLAIIYFESHKTIPDEVVLYLPYYHEKSKKIFFNRSPYRLKMNPLTAEPKGIFNAWESAFDKALLEAEVQISKDKQEV